MNLHIFPTKFIYWSRIKNHNKIKEKYYPLILKNQNEYGSKFRETVSKKWNCDCYSSFFSPEDTKNIFDDDFSNEVIWSVFDEMLNVFNNSPIDLSMPIPKQSRICDIWYNHYDHGMYQEIHNHSHNNPIVHFSGIYLMELNEDNTTIFFNKNECKFYSDKIDVITYDTKHIGEGNVIIFPSELLHYVNPSLKGRTTVSFNITSEY
jgi:predicted 2-oxoglutarate/Fe(II)-dependent dioxygenase YbiX